MSGLVLAADPGLTTGIAWRDDRGSHAFEADWYDALVWLEGQILRYGPEVRVVCESYIITANTLKKSRQNWSLEAIGALRYFCRKAGAPELELQPPGEAKGFATDEKLKLLGWYRPTPGGHTNDATRHLVTFLVRRGLLDPALLLRREPGAAADGKV